MKYKDITGIILCGGKSSRMGSDKAFLKIEKKTIIEIVYESVKNIFNDVIIVANRREDYRFLTDKVYRDIYKDTGPLGGIHTGLCYTHNERNFIVSCDMPFVTPEIIRYICDYRTDRRITVPEADSRLQTLCAVYDRSCIEQTEILLRECMEDDGQNRKRCSPLELYEHIKPEIIKVEQLHYYHPNIFFNMNKPEDYEYVLSRYNRVYC